MALCARLCSLVGRKTQDNDCNASEEVSQAQQSLIPATEAVRKTSSSEAELTTPRTTDAPVEATKEPEPKCTAEQLNSVVDAVRQQRAVRAEHALKEKLKTALEETEDAAVATEEKDCSEAAVVPPASEEKEATKAATDDHPAAAAVSAPVADEKETATQKLEENKQEEKAIETGQSDKSSEGQQQQQQKERGQRSSKGKGGGKGKGKGKGGGKGKKRNSQS